MLSLRTAGDKILPVIPSHTLNAATVISPPSERTALHMKLTLAVRNQQRELLGEAAGQDRVSLVYPPEYQTGDVISLTCEQPGFYEVRFEDSMPVSMVYIQKEAVFAIPEKDRMIRIGYAPRSFEGPQHLITAAVANPAVAGARRNLALNPYDAHGDTGMFPHAVANVETRGEALFAARNAIDGILSNHAHYPYPFQSWGINRDPHAQLRVDFGVPVDIDTMVLVLRADYPHDNYWVKATLAFSDGSSETVSPVKTAEPQAFPMEKKGVSWVVLRDLIPSDDPSPFPALTQIEAWGTVCRGDAL